MTTTTTTTHPSVAISRTTSRTMIVVVFFGILAAMIDFPQQSAWLCTAYIVPSSSSNNRLLFGRTTWTTRHHHRTNSQQTQQQQQQAVAALASSTTASSSSDFDAFADSLEVDDSQAGDVGSGSDSSRSTSNRKNSAAGAATATDTTIEKSWQAKLERLLDPTTNVADRQILLSDLLNSNQEIRDSVLDALSNRNLDPLLTPTQKKLQDGTRAVVRQLANDILPQITKSAATATSRVGPPSPLGSSSESTSSSFSSSSTSSSSTTGSSSPVSPSDLESIGNRLFSVVSNQIQKNFEELQDDLTDPLNKIPQRLSKQTEEVLQEAKNVFLETPEGLEEPSYSIVDKCDLYEIRDYEGYTVASTSMGRNNNDSASIEGVAAGQAFNVLAAYLFGGNEDNKSMSMTTPVTTTSSGEMRFYLNEPVESIPKPSGGGGVDSLDRSIEIVDVPPARLAIRKFTGFATDGEVARQKDVLLQALSMDGVELDVNHGAIVPHIVFQYNPPYTLPMVRRNEIAVPVRNSESEPVTSLKNEWNVDDEEGEEEELDGSGVNGFNDLAPSD